MKTLSVEIKRRFLSRRLKVFERKLKKGTVTPDKVETLFQRLSSISNGFKQLERVYPFARPDISADLDHIVSLYGRIITLNQEHEVNTIAKKAEELEKKITQTDCTALAHEVDALKDHIYAFCRDNRPSKEGRRVLSVARRSAKRAESVILGEPCDESDSLGDEEEAEDLFEIAYLYFSGKPQDGSRAFNALSQALKTRCYEHLKTLRRNPDDVFRWQQALLATAFEITETEEAGRYFSPDEMDAFFQERQELEL